jgi:hypothetical protein
MNCRTSGCTRKRLPRIRSLASAKHIATMGVLPIPNGGKSLRFASQQIEPLNVRSGSGTTD